MSSSQNTAGQEAPQAATSGGPSIPGQSPAGTSVVTVTSGAGVSKLAPKPQREILVTTSPIALMDTAQFEHMQRIATLMSKMDLLPLHLRVRPWFYPKKKTDNLAPADEKKWRDELGPEGFARAWADADQRTVANCILVVDQALRWGMNPFATMGETFEVGGKLGNQGKLVAAVVNARAGLKERLSYTFAGEPKTPSREVTVHGTFQGEEVERTITLSVAEGKTDNQMWVKDPDQKLIYSGVVKWARRHCPEVILGIITDDDMDRMAMEAGARSVATPSQLDAFAAGGPVQNGTIAGQLPPPAGSGGVIDLAGAVVLPSPEAPGITPQPAAGIHPDGETAAGEIYELDLAATAAAALTPSGAPATRPRLTMEKIQKLRALVRQPPKVEEGAVAGKLGAAWFDELQGDPGEASEDLYTRVLAEIQAAKAGG